MQGLSTLLHLKACIAEFSLVPLCSEGLRKFQLKISPSFLTATNHENATCIGKIAFWFNSTGTKSPLADISIPRGFAVVTTTARAFLGAHVPDFANDQKKLAC